MSRPFDSMRRPQGWKPGPRRRFSRRRFLAGGSAAAFSAGLAFAGCSDRDEDNLRGNSQGAARTPGSTPPPTQDEPALAEATATPEETGDPSLTVTGFVFGDGQFDPHKTQVGALHGQQAFIYSRLLSYEDQAAGDLSPDLADAMPEQPDDDTYVFHLRSDARWHDREPLGGRRLTAEDVVHSLQRQIEGDDAFVYQSRWDFIDSIEATDDDEIVITTDGPFAGALSRLASPPAMVVPPEFDDAGGMFGQNLQIGSGPFKWIEWDERNFASVGRNPDWHGSSPRLSGVTLVEPKDSTTVEAMLRVRDLDVAFLGAPQADALKESIPSLNRQEVGNALFFGMRFYTPASPYDDVRFRKALSIALDREGLVDDLFQGAGEPNAWVSWPVTNWALSQSELADVPGYRQGEDGRERDIEDARALLESMRSDDIDVPASLTLHAEVSSEEQLSLGSFISRQLWNALEIDVRLEYVPIDELVDRHFGGDAPWIAGPDTGWLDLDDWVYPYFHSSGHQNSFAVRDDDLDELLEAQRVEMDTDDRRELGKDIQRRLLEINAGVNLVSERIVALSWPYVRDFPLDITDGYQDRFAGCWIDRDDPSYRG